MPISLLVASPEERFRETIRESLVNIDGAKVVSEYPEVSSNLYIRVQLKIWSAIPMPPLIVDLSGETGDVSERLSKKWRRPRLISM